METKLTAREKELELALRMGQMGHWRLFVATDELVWSDELYRIYGLDPKKVKITRKLAMSMKLSEDSRRFTNAINNFSPENPTTQFEYKLRRTDGEIRQIRGNVFPEYDEDGVHVSFFGISQDITDFQKILQSKEVFEKRFEDLIELAADWYWEMDADLKLSYVSDRMTQITGLEPSSFIGKTRKELIVDLEGHETWKEHLDDLQKRRPFRNFNYSHRNSAGETLYWSTSGKPVFDEEGQFSGYRGTGTDITQQTVLEEKLRQSQKMQAVGQLTGGVAHDFNNILAIIQGNAELLKEQLEQGKPINPDSLTAILKSAQKGADLTNSLLSFSRKQDLKPVAIDLMQELESIVVFLRRTVGETIQVSMTHHEDLWSCIADIGQLENAVLNLCLNARDAMPGGGKLEISSDNISLPAKAANQMEIEAGDYVSIAVTDTGFGIPKENLTHIFEPFFTTKDIGRGTGLGLSMVYGFAKQSGGTVTFQSSLAKGTTATIYLPRSAEAHLVSDGEEAKRAVSGQGSILVVEDNPDVRALVVEQLGSLGYQTMEAAEGAEALEILAQNGPVDLLLSDVILPGGLKGPEVAEKAKLIQPTIKVIFMSGYTSNAFDATNTEDDFPVTLEKPFKKSDLSRAVQAALEESH